MWVKPSLSDATSELFNISACWRIWSFYYNRLSKIVFIEWTKIGPRLSRDLMVWNWSSLGKLPKHKIYYVVIHLTSFKSINFSNNSSRLWIEAMPKSSNLQNVSCAQQSWSWQKRSIYMSRYCRSAAELFSFGSAWQQHDLLIGSEQFSQTLSKNTIFDRMSTWGAHLILGAWGEAIIRKGSSFERGAH